MSVVKGKAKRFNGDPIDYVLLFDWNTGARIGKSVPDSLGNWKFYYQSDLRCGITYVADGCEPISHGAYDLTHTVLPDFVEYIGSVNSLDRSTGSSAVLTTIPSTVKEGDMLVMSVMHRGGVTITDSNGGLWLLGASASAPNNPFNQSTSIYYRSATAGDAGETLSVNTDYSGRLITYLSVYRGKFKKLKFSEAFSNPVRYDATYKELSKNLAPIAHSGGFMVRAVSKVYSISTGLSKVEISDMTNTGATELQNPEQLRLQVAYKHLPTADIFSGVNFETNTGNDNDSILDVAIMLNEV